jgi:hypothetical protein
MFFIMPKIGDKNIARRYMIKEIVLANFEL